MPDAFFHRDGEHYLPSELTRGPWRNDHQHGGPPAALLAGALEAHGADAADFFVARISFDFLRPVPLSPLRIVVQPERLGGKVQRIAGSLLDRDGEVVMRGFALRTRKRALDVDVRCGEPLPGPDSAPPFRFPFFRAEVGYHTAMEGRFVRGRWGDNPVAAWLRARVPLVGDEPTTPLQRVCTVADAESGVCPPLPVDRYTFINPDLTVLLERPLEGEWVGLDVVSSAAPQGIGIAQSVIHDLGGAIGRAAQSLVVDRRG